MNTWMKEQEELLWFFQAEEKGSEDLRSAEEERMRESVSGAIQSQFFLFVTHMHASVHKKNAV